MNLVNFAISSQTITTIKWFIVIALFIWLLFDILGLLGVAAIESSKIFRKQADKDSFKVLILALFALLFSLLLFVP